MTERAPALAPHAKISPLQIWSVATQTRTSVSLFSLSVIFLRSLWISRMNTTAAPHTARTHPLSRLHMRMRRNTRTSVPYGGKKRIMVRNQSSQRRLPWQRRQSKSRQSQIRRCLLHLSTPLHQPGSGEKQEKHLKKRVDKSREYAYHCSSCHYYWKTCTRKDKI